VRGDFGVLGPGLDSRPDACPPHIKTSSLLASSCLLALISTGHFSLSSLSLPHLLYRAWLGLGLSLSLSLSRAVASGMVVSPGSPANPRLFRSCPCVYTLLYCIVHPAYTDCKSIWQTLTSIACSSQQHGSAAFIYLSLYTVSQCLPLPAGRHNLTIPTCATNIYRVYKIRSICCMHVLFACILYSYI